MILGRLISLLLSAALVACPVVCRAGGCNDDCPMQRAETAACPHCLATENEQAPCKDGDTSDRLPNPMQQSHCELGNCLCAGAVTSGGGVDLQISHELGVFAACEALCEYVQSSNLPAIASTLANSHDDPQASGWGLRLRIESLLI
jgi:hypothetical protein